MTPKPGIYDGVSPEQYFAWNAVSNSRLGLLRRSPLHYRHGFAETSESMLLGTLVHNGVLEPLQIPLRYVVMPDYAAHPENVTRDGKRSFNPGTAFVRTMEEAFRRLHHDKEIVSATQYDQMLRVAAALSQCPAARALFRDSARRVWTTRQERAMVEVSAAKFLGVVRVPADN